MELLPKAVFNAGDFFGWTYQFRQADEKDRTNSSGTKIGAGELSAVTQRFTERCAQVFLHNSIGAWRAGKVLANGPDLAASATDKEPLRWRIRLMQAMKMTSRTCGSYDKRLKTMRTRHGWARGSRGWEYLWGMARAARIISDHYTLVVINVLLVVPGKQNSGIRSCAARHHGDAKYGIAMLFASRILQWLGDYGTQAVVTPQDCLFLSTYRKLWKRLLIRQTWNLVTRLGEHAIADSQVAKAFAALVILSANGPVRSWEMVGMDVSAPRGPRLAWGAQKTVLLEGPVAVTKSRQEERVRNPDSAVLLRPVGDRKLLQQLAHGHPGIASADYIPH